MLLLHRIVKQKKDLNDYIPLHSHSYFHCIYGLDGEARVQYHDEAITVSKGMFLCLCPNAPHAIYGIHNFQSFDIKFSCTFELSRMLQEIPAVTMLNHFEDSILKDIFHEAIQGSAFSEEIINSQMTNLIYRLLRKNQINSLISYDILPSASALHDKAVSSYRLQSAIQYIDTHLAGELNIPLLASLCGYNVSYFSIIFKEIFGLSPSNYINSRRVDKAKDLLLTSDYSITAIADLLGISLHSFSRMFKNAVGISPVQYYKRANSDIGINVSKSSPYFIKSPFEIPMVHLLENQESVDNKSPNGVT